MTDKMVEANGITIRTESFGDKEGVPLILIMGATAPGIYWPEPVSYTHLTLPTKA